MDYKPVKRGKGWHGNSKGHSDAAHGWKTTLDVPYRKDYQRKGVDGPTGSLMVIRERIDPGFGSKMEWSDNWSVSKRKYSAEKGGYYEVLKTGLTKKEAEQYARKQMR
jgi:hypothetical protein